MSHTYANLLSHIIFSTKERRPYIDEELKPPLLAYMGGILRETHCIAMLINGVADHVHLLVAVPPILSIADVMRILKDKLVALGSRKMEDTQRV
jgi:putative transposase